MAEPGSFGMKSKFGVLLATFNGERFLEEQIASLDGQDAESIDIYASDDGSVDGTIAILRRWQSAWTKGRFEILDGPRASFAENFRSLILRAERNVEYVSFSDQDDIWDSAKLSRAVEALEKGADVGPGVYFSRTRLVDTSGTPCGFSPLFGRKPGFKNALVQSIGGGNTMVLNRSGFEVVRESARRVSFVSHDWWCYLVVAGAGGRVIYDAVPHISFRQHPGNLVGNNTGWVGRVRRIVDGRFAAWTDRNLDGLDRCHDLLAIEAWEALQEFRAMRSVGPLAALDRLKKSGIYRQSRSSDLALRVAVALGRI